MLKWKTNWLMKVSQFGRKMEGVYRNHWNNYVRRNNYVRKIKLTLKKIINSYDIFFLNPSKTIFLVD